MKKQVLAAAACLLFVGAGCTAPASPAPEEIPAPAVPGSPSAENGLPTEGWELADTGAFTVALPPGWEFRPMQGIDSLVGEFTGDGAALSFDYGWYSNPLAGEEDPDHAVTYETIDGRRAKIVVPRVVGRGTTGVYVEGLGTGGMDRLQVSGENLTAAQQETVLGIFRTIRFAE